MWGRVVWSTVWNGPVHVMLEPLRASPSKHTVRCWSWTFYVLPASPANGLDEFQVSSRGAFGQTHKASGLPRYCHGYFNKWCSNDSSELCENWAACGSPSTCWSHPSTLQQGPGMWCHRSNFVHVVWLCEGLCPHSIFLKLFCSCSACLVQTLQVKINKF